MTQTHFHTTPHTADAPCLLPREMRLSEEIRDGLLQDLVAVALILRDLERHAEAEEATEERCRLASASTAIDADVRAVRALIARLRATA